MIKLRSAVFLLLMLIISSVPAMAQDDDDIPTVALVKYGSLRPLDLAQQGALDLFAEYGYVDGENINFIITESEFNLDVLDNILAAVLESEPDVIIASATPVVIKALALTAEMENPPIVLSSAVTSVYGTGIAQSSCIKPANFSGSQALPPFDLMLEIIQDFDPSIERIGVIFNEDEANSVFSVGLISEFAEEMGIEIISQPVTSAGVVAAAAETMLMSGLDAFLVPPDATVFSAVPDLTDIATLAGIPVITTVDDQVYSGATLGIGLDYYQEGIDNARMAIAYLQGDLDIETTAISNQTGLAIAVNLDSAMAQGIDIDEDFLDNASYVIEDGESSESDPSLADITFEERQELDMAYLADLVCTDERIAEEESELDD